MRAFKKGSLNMKWYFFLHWERK